MQPTLACGDFVVASKLKFSLSEGDLVIAYHPVYGQMVKRIKSISSTHGFLLTGDNSQSVSSEAMGWIARESIKAKVLFPIRAIAKSSSNSAI